MDNKQLAIFQNDSGAIELSIDSSAETIWATQAQVAKLFEVTPQNVTMHIKSIYIDKEMDEDTTCKKSLQVQHEGERIVQREVFQYNLDVIIAIGYRISSSKGTMFRKWATKTLRNYIADGFIINPDRIADNKTQFQRALADMKLLATNSDAVGSSEVADLASAFANTWFSLDAYDRSSLPHTGNIKQAVILGAGDLQLALGNLRTQLIAKGEATDIFGTEREKDGLAALFGNVFQAFDGEDVYLTVEEKAAHLLYFVVKNHVFLDGNKRSGAYAFIWFLKEVGILNITEISPQALTAITLLVAESDPKDKNKMIGLVLLMLGVHTRKD